MKQLTTDYNDYAILNQGEKVCAIDPKTMGVVFTMIQEYSGEPIQAQKAFIAALRRSSKFPIFEHYIKRNDTLFADVPVYGIPLVLNAFNNQSHQSVVEGLEGVTDDLVAAVGL